MVIISIKTSKCEAQILLTRGLLLVLLGVQLVVLQGCTTSRDHKWLFYELEKENDVIYQGYTTTRFTGQESDLTQHARVHADVRASIKNKTTPLDILIPLDKPTVDEDDQLHFVFFGQRSRLEPETTFCRFTENDYQQSHDSKMAPPFAMPAQKPGDSKSVAANQLSNAQAEVDKYTKLVESKRQEKEKLAKESTSQEEKLKKLQPNHKSFNQEMRKLETLRAKSRTVEAELLAAQHQLLEARFILLQTEKQSIELAQKGRAAFVCDLDVREKGGRQFVTNLTVNQNGIGGENKDDKSGKIIFKDTILVHELYRFRVLAGPVFSTVQKQDKKYEVKSNAQGTGNEVTASPASISPANFALMLKTYLWAKRDLLNPPSLFSSRWYELINPVIGINLYDDPLEHLYTGLSLELAGGFDIVGGVHWAKTDQLTGGFQEGPTTQTDVQTKKTFVNGWFVGVAADLGIVTTWLKAAGSAMAGAFKSTP